MKKKINILDVIVLAGVFFIAGSAFNHYFLDSLSAGSVDQAINKQNTERVASDAGVQKLRIDWNGIYLKDAKVFKKDRPVVIGFREDGMLMWGYAPSDKEKVEKIARELKTSDPD